MPSLDFHCDFSAWSDWGAKAAARLGRLESVHEKIGDYLLEEIQRNFERSGGAKQWAPLHRDTLTPGRLKFGIKPLVRSGWLQKNIKKIVQSAFVDVGSDWVKSKKLFFGGTTIFKGELRPVPERNPFDWVPGVLDRVQEMYLRWIVLGSL